MGDTIGALADGHGPPRLANSCRSNRRLLNVAIACHSWPVGRSVVGDSLMGFEDIGAGALCPAKVLCRRNSQLSGRMTKIRVVGSQLRAPYDPAAVYDLRPYLVFPKEYEAYSFFAHIKTGGHILLISKLKRMCFTLYIKNRIWGSWLNLVEFQSLCVGRKLVSRSDQTCCGRLLTLTAVVVFRNGIVAHQRAIRESR